MRVWLLVNVVSHDAVKCGKCCSEFVVNVVGHDAGAYLFGRMVASWYSGDNCELRWDCCHQLPGLYNGQPHSFIRSSGVIV